MLSVSIHAFRGEGDRDRNFCVCRCAAFQSTPSGGKATQRPSPVRFQIRMFQSTPSGGKATLDFDRRWRGLSRFQSTPSGGKATGIVGNNPGFVVVSIHAFRGEGDPVLRRVCQALERVSIHAFRGEGDHRNVKLIRVLVRFNPRLPGGRRPNMIVIQQLFAQVSIHAFRGEGDLLSSSTSKPSAQFQSTPSGGKATNTQLDDCSPLLGFQSTPSGGKATLCFRQRRLFRNGFNPRLPGGRRPLSPQEFDRWASVSIHAFRGEGDFLQHTGI